MAEKENRVKSSLGGAKKKDSKKKSSKKSDSKGGKKRRVHKMHLSRTDNDKFIAEHEFEPSESGDASKMPMRETHSLNDVDELKDHVAEHFSPEEEEAASQGGGGAPAGAQPQMA